MTRINQAAYYKFNSRFMYCWEKTGLRQYLAFLNKRTYFNKIAFLISVWVPFCNL